MTTNHPQIAQIAVFCIIDTRVQDHLRNSGKQNLSREEGKTLAKKKNFSTCESSQYRKRARREMEEPKDRGDEHGSKFNERSKGQQNDKSQVARVNESHSNMAMNLEGDLLLEAILANAGQKVMRYIFQSMMEGVIFLSEEGYPYITLKS